MRKFQLIIFILFALIMATDSFAQNTFLKIKWYKSARLEDVGNDKTSLGIAGPVAGVVGKNIIVAGGANFPDAMPWLGGKKKYYSNAFVYRPSGKKLRLSSVWQLPQPVAYAASCNTNEGFVYAGGETVDGKLSSRVYYVSLRDKKLQFTALPSLPVPLANASLVYSGDSLYIIGGESVDFVSNKIYSLHFRDSSIVWMEAGTLPHAMSHGIAVKNEDGKISIIGGRRRNPGAVSDLYSDVFLFDPLSGSVSKQQPLPYALSAGSGIAYGNEVFVFGGDDGTTFHKAEAVIAAKAKETDEERKSQLDKERILIQSTHPGFNKNILWLDDKAGQWKSIGIFPFELPITTAALQRKKKVFIASGEIKAGVRTPLIFMGKIKNR